MIRVVFLLFFCCTFTGTLFAQDYFTGVVSKWSDEFTEWDLYTYPEVAEEEEALEAEELAPSGTFIMRWQSRGDWNTWDYTLNDQRGYIRTLFTDDPGKWELVGPQNEVITFRQIWANDHREWRVTDNRSQLTFKTKWGNRMDEWMVRGESHGSFDLYTSWEGDPREWEIVDELDEEISTEMKLAMIFIAVFNSSAR